MGTEHPTLLPVRQTRHTHTPELLQLLRSCGGFQRTKPIYLRGVLTLFCLKINMQSFYDLNYSPIGNELRVSSFFRVDHFIAGGASGPMSSCRKLCRQQLWSEVESTSAQWRGLPCVSRAVACFGGKIKLGLRSSAFSNFLDLPWVILFLPLPLDPQL